MNDQGQRINIDICIIHESSPLIFNLNALDPHQSPDFQLLTFKCILYQMYQTPKGSYLSLPLSLSIQD